MKLITLKEKTTDKIKRFIYKNYIRKPKITRISNKEVTINDTSGEVITSFNLCANIVTETLNSGRILVRCDTPFSMLLSIK